MKGTYVYAISLPVRGEMAHAIAHAGQLHRGIGGGGEVSENATVKWIVQLCRAESKNTMPDKDPEGPWHVQATQAIFPARYSAVGRMKIPGQKYRQMVDLSSIDRYIMGPLRYAAEAYRKATHKGEVRLHSHSAL